MQPALIPKPRYITANPFPNAALILAELQTPLASLAQHCLLSISPSRDRPATTGERRRSQGLAPRWSERPTLRPTAFGRLFPVCQFPLPLRGLRVTSTSYPAGVSVGNEQLDDLGQKATRFVVMPQLSAGRTDGFKAVARGRMRQEVTHALGPLIGQFQGMLGRQTSAGKALKHGRSVTNVSGRSTSPEGTRLPRPFLRPIH